MLVASLMLLSSLVPGGAEATGGSADASGERREFDWSEPWAGRVDRAVEGDRRALPKVVEVGTSVSTSQPAGVPSIGRALAGEVDPGAQAMAQVLGGDPVAIYNFVKTEVAFDPAWGRLRDPQRTIRERAGTAADQAALLVEMLRSAGHQASPVSGVASLPLETAASLVRVQAHRSVFETCVRVFRAFVAGGTPVGNPPSCADDRTPIFEVEHVFVSAVVDGKTVLADPAVKRSARVEGLDVAAASGYDRARLLAAALNGARPGQDSISHLSTSAVAGELEAGAARLLDAIDAQRPNGHLVDVIGGWRLDERPVAALSPHLPYRTHMRSSPAHVDALSTVLTVKVLTSGGSQLATWSAPLHQTAGRRLAYAFDASGGALRFDGTSVAAVLRTGERQILEVCIDSPLADDDGDTCASHAMRTTAGHVYGIVSDAGSAPGSLLDERRRTMDEVTGAEHTAEALNVLGLSWFRQNGLARRLHGGISSTHGSLLSGVAFVSAHDETFDIDIGIHYRSIVSETADEDDEDASFAAQGLQASAFEHAVIEQLGVDAVSTVRVLDLANSAGMRVFAADQSSWSRVRPQLLYGAATMADFDAEIAAGARLVLPERDVALNDWTGTGWLSFVEGATGYLISGGLRGGAATERAAQIPHKARDRREMQQRALNPPVVSSEILDPVDPVTGAFTLGENDVSVRGLRPISLGGFGRSYDSLALESEAGMGPGWRHSFSDALYEGIDPYAALGAFAAIDAVRLIGQAVVMLDLSRSDVAAEPVRSTLAALVSKWGIDRLGDRRLTLIGGSQPSATFVPVPGSGAAMRAVRARLEAEPQPDGTVTLLGAGRERQVFEPLPQQPGVWRLRSLGDANDNVVRVAYTPAGVPSHVTDSAGRRFDFTFDVDGRPTRVTAPRGALVRYGYTSDRLATVTNPVGAVTRYTYDSSGRVTSVTDPVGNRIVSNTYDDLGRVVAQTDALGSRFTLSYADHATVAVDPLGGRLTIAIAPDGSWHRVTDQAGVTTTSVLDASGNATLVTDGLGHSTRYRYDPSGNLLEVIDALGGRTSFTYNADDLPVRATNPSGITTSYAYDARANLMTTTNALGHQLSMTYDARGRPVTATESLTGSRSTYTYDGAGNLTSLTNAAGRTSRLRSDAAGRPLQTTDALGRTTKLAYDAVGRIVGATDQAGRTATVVHDANGNDHITTDVSGRSAIYERDAMSNLVRLVRPDGTSYRHVYDALQRPVAFVDSNGNTWQTERDARGLVVAETDPLGNRSTFAHDAVGRLTERTDAEGTTTSYRYDALGRLTEIDYGDGKVARYTYRPDGAMTSAALGPWLERYTHDALGRVVRTEQPHLGRTLETIFDELEGAASPGSPMRQVMMVRGQVVETTDYRYGPQHELVSMTDGTGTTTYAYDDVGRPIETLFPNGVRQSTAYDVLSRVIAMTTTDPAGSPVMSTSYAYGGVANIVRLDRRTPQEELVSTYDYDALDRLVEERSGAESVQYGYDAVGNRLIRTDASGATISTYDGANRLLAAGDARYTYDRNGSLLSRTDASGTTRFSWTPERQLARIDPPSGSPVGFAYDAFGRHFARGEAGVGVEFTWWDGLRQLASADGLFTTGTIFGGGKRRVEHARPVGAGQPAFLADEVTGSSGLTSDAGGRARRFRSSDAFGISRRDAGPVDAVGSTHADGTSDEAAVPGLRRMGFRYYDAQAGRFVTRDPLGFAAGDQNLYAYANNDPVGSTDPDGLIATGVSNFDILQHPVEFEGRPVVVIRLREEDFAKERDRMLQRMAARRAATATVYAWEAANFDSGFWEHFRDHTFEYQGRRMLGHEVNYFFQGQMAYSYGASIETLERMVSSWKQLKYGHEPSPATLDMARKGFEDTQTMHRSGQLPSSAEPNFFNNGIVPAVMSGGAKAAANAKVTAKNLIDAARSVGRSRSWWAAE